MKLYTYLTVFTILFFTLIMYTDAKGQVDARMLRNPDVSQTHIAFVYANDIWIVSKEGGVANRLTNAEGPEMFPKFSPDGSHIAYMANYNGNNDIYVIPSMGGTPERLTHHPMDERVLDWYPDGNSILFASPRESGRQRFSQFYRVSVEGGLAEKLPIPYGEFGSISPDGKSIAYTPKSRAFRTWKRYRGGMNADIYLFNLDTYASERITDTDANDEHPMWYGSLVYYLSDKGSDQRNNLWIYDTTTGEERQLTTYTEYDIHFPSIGPDELVYEAGGILYAMDLESEETREVSVDVITDYISLQTRTEQVNNLIQNADISPSGNRVVFQARGEILSVPAKNGPVINLTRSSGVAERYPAWSNDGKLLAYWSDRTGEYELVIRDNSGSGDESILTDTGEKFKYSLFWSPDNTMLAFVDNANRIRIYDRDEDELMTIDTSPWMGEGQLAAFTMDWSADSRWLTYSRQLSSLHTAVFLYDTENDELTQATSGYYPDQNPVFDPDGNYLYFISGRTYNPLYGDLDGSWIYANISNLVLVPLTVDTDSPFAPKNDEVQVTDDEDYSGNGEEEVEEESSVTIDLNTFEERAIHIPVEAGNYRSLSALPGKLFYLKAPRTGSGGNGATLNMYDLEAQEEKEVMANVNGYAISAKGNKILVISNGQFGIIDPAPGQSISNPLRVTEMTSNVDPRAEWQQIFEDAWRFSRDYFYDENMHGVDWDAMKERYQRMLNDAVTREDVNYVIGELIAELNASHTYRGGGDVEDATNTSVGLLGVDWELVNGSYRIANIIDGGPWDSEVRSPLNRPGLDVEVGDYILSVNGTPIHAESDPYAAFQGLAGKTVELLINETPDMDGARSILVETLPSETRLRHLAWIESNRKRVEEATDGRVGYIYVRSTGVDGQNELYRQFMGQYHKEALIIDERFNSGGQIPDRFIELLNRPELAYWAVRDGEEIKWPPISHFGPKVMLINGWSGSGGDAFPAYFKETGLGPLIGTRTWGGLIGISGSPNLVDGGTVTVPTFRMYYPDGEWFPEGHGVEPDIYVEDDPTQLARGVDPQLERAIEETLRLMRIQPYTKPPRPASEDRSGN